eukprot:CFRG5182T1
MNLLCSYRSGSVYKDYSPDSSRDAAHALDPNSDTLYEHLPNTRTSETYSVWSRHKYQTPYFMFYMHSYDDGHDHQTTPG